MNERDTTINKTTEIPNYRIDNSRIIKENQEIEKETVKPISANKISNTKIININDFIFRQYLEFYPNLQGLICKDNILYLKENNEIVASETLTFDLRTLPGEAWSVSSKDFMGLIKINKSCSDLESFVNLLNQNAFNNFTINKEELENEVTNYMNLYFSIKDSFRYLIEDNKILIGNIETLIATLPKETELGKIVNQKLDEYFEITKEMNDSKTKGMVLELKNKNVPAIIPNEPAQTHSSKAAFVNIAII